MDFPSLVKEDRRLALLRFLEDSGGDYSLNTSLLQTALANIGHAVSRDVVTADAAWLEEQGLTTLEILGPITVVHLTQRGADVAMGRARHPGIKKPSPRL